MWSSILITVGGGTLGYLLQSIPPTLSSGQWNLPVITLFMAALALLVSGIGALVALRLHQRWPAMGGAQRQAALKPEIALRQGSLLSGADLIWFMLGERRGGPHWSRGGWAIPAW